MQADKNYHYNLFQTKKCGVTTQITDKIKNEKIITVLLIAIVTTFATNAQIPNSGFEDWSTLGNGLIPDGQQITITNYKKNHFENCFYHYSDIAWSYSLYGICKSIWLCLHYADHQRDFQTSWYPMVIDGTNIYHSDNVILIKKRCGVDSGFYPPPNQSNF